MSYGEVVYRLGKRYSQERELNPQVEYPYFHGQLADLVDQKTLTELPELIGEYFVAYNDGQGTRHAIRIYFDNGTFEAEGTPAPSDIFNISADLNQDADD
jgi:hypothetical protein